MTLDIREVTVWLFAHGLRILVIILIGFLLLRLMAGAIRRVEREWLLRPAKEGDDRVQRARTLTRLLQNAGTVVIVIVALMMILSELRINIGPVLAGLGIFGLALGFGTQSLARDAVSGFFVLAEDLFAIGDVVRAGGAVGTVEKMTIRTTHLRDNEGATHVIPNGSLGIVTNYTRDWARAAVEVALPSESNEEAALTALREAGEKVGNEVQADDILSGPDLTAVVSPGQRNTVLRLGLRTRSARQWAVVQVLQREARAALSDLGLSGEVSIASPSVSVDELARIVDS